MKHNTNTKAELTHPDSSEKFREVIWLVSPGNSASVTRKLKATTIAMGHTLPNTSFTLPCCIEGPDTMPTEVEGSLPSSASAMALSAAPGASWAMLSPYCAATAPDAGAGAEAYSAPVATEMFCPV